MFFGNIYRSTTNGLFVVGFLLFESNIPGGTMSIQTWLAF